jgi:uncharacterized delta-60 repeat protein
VAKIDSVLSKLNAGHGQITDAVNDLFYFTDDRSTTLDCDCNGQAVMAVAKHTSGDMILAGEGFLDINEGGDCCFSYVTKVSSSNVTDESFTKTWFGDTVYTVGIQSTGKIILGGWFGSYNSGSGWVNMNSYAIARLNADGTFDSTFDTNVNNIFQNGPNYVINKIVVLEDDSILVCGRFDYNVDTDHTKLVKLNIDGTLDETFTNNVAANNFDIFALYDIAVDSVGKIIVVGGYTNNTGFIAKLNSDGTLDESFTAPDIIVDACCYDCFVKTVEVQSDNKIIIGGIFDLVDSNSAVSIARLSSAGAYDDTFAPTGTGLQYYSNPDNGDDFYYPYVSKIKVQSDNKLIVAGDFNSYNESTRNYICRLTANGGLDSSFGNPTDFYNDNSDYYRQEVDGWDYYNSIFDVCIVSSSEIWVGGYFIQPKRYYAKLNGSGVASFGSPFKIRTTGISNSNFDMYDSGNFYNTDLTQVYSSIDGGEGNSNLSIPSTHTQMTNDVADNPDDSMGYAYIPSNPDGSVEDGTSYFGAGSSYFTNMYPGMFVLVATGVNVEEFSITGNIGADGNTTYGVDVLSLTSKGNLYSVFVKTVSAESDETAPTHLIIVPGTSDGITHLYDESTDWDDHTVQGISNKTELYAITVSKKDGTLFTTPEYTALAKKFLDTITENPNNCSQVCSTGFKCLTNSTCSCRKWRFFYSGCNKRQQVLGICSGLSGAYVPAITVCNQKLF